MGKDIHTNLYDNNNNNNHSAFVYVWIPFCVRRRRLVSDRIGNLASQPTRLLLPEPMATISLVFFISNPQ